MAVHHRDARGTGVGQGVDVALSEAVFGLMESLVPEFDRGGHVRERAGNPLPGIAPTGTYRCSDGMYIVIAGNGDSIFKRLMQAIGRPELAQEPRFARNNGRAADADYLDQLIESWTIQHPAAHVQAVMDRAGVPATTIYSVADMVEDPHFLARGMIESVQIPGLGPLRIPGIVPKLSETPGATHWTGPALGAHNEEIYRGLLQLSESELAEFQRRGIV